MADAPREEIRQTFRAKFKAAGKPADMAVYTRHDSEGRLHCEVTAYFSPAAAEVAKAFDAQPCNPPRKTGLELLAGSESSWARLFD